MTDSPRPVVGEASALVVEVPPADPVVGDWRRRYDPVSRYGMPAHVTILYPFRKPHEIDPNVLAEALDAIGDHAPFTVTFSSVGTFDDGVVYLAPDPPDPFVRLTESLVAVFPDCPPYGGRFDATIPHLTVASGIDDDPRAGLVSALGHAVEVTPITMAVGAVSLFTHTEAGGWVRRTSIPLGTAPVVG